MMNYSLVLLPVNKPNADFTFWICVTPLLRAYWQNARYFTDLQQLLQCRLSLTGTKNMPNHYTAMPNTILVRWQSRAIHH